MSDVALTTIGIILGWGVETKKGEKPASFKEIEECVGIGSAAVSVDSIDVTCTKATRRKRKKGLEDAGDSLTTTFNYSDTFLEQWGEMYSAYETAKKSGLGIWFEAYHPDRENACYYIVEPGRPGKPEISVGGTYQTEVSNVIVDLPDDSTAIKPTEPTASGN